MILFDSSILNTENIEDENEHKSLCVPLFPNRKKPLNDTQLKSYNLSSSSTPLRLQFTTMLESNKQKRELEILILKDLMKVKTQDLYYGISQKWIQQYNLYLYRNGKKPDNLNNSNCPNYIVVNQAVWQFFKEEYNAFPEVICEPKYLRNNKKRAKTVEPINRHQSQNIKRSNYEIPLIGMKNEAYNCYMHAGLQSLLSIVDFNYFIIKYVHRITTQQTYNLASIQINSFINSYYELIQQIKSTTSPIKLNSLQPLINNQFHPKNQHDCHEFLLYLLGQIEDEILKFNKHTKSKFINPIQQLFKGKLQSTITCSVCKHKLSQIEPFLILSLAISQTNSLESSLDEFFQEELLRDYLCPQCQAVCIKKLDILFTPQILVLHLKRFQYTPTCTKNIQTITYPMDNLHFSNKTYRLKSVVVHKGTLQQGHYFSFAKRYHKWFLFNDEIVKSASKSQVLEQTAYILFYQINEFD